MFTAERVLTNLSATRRVTGRTCRVKELVELQAEAPRNFLKGKQSWGLRSAEDGRLAIDFRVSIRGRQKLLWEWDSVQRKLVERHSLPGEGLQAVEYPPGDCWIYFPQSYTAEQMTDALPTIVSHFGSKELSRGSEQALTELDKQLRAFNDFGSNPLNILVQPFTIFFYDDAGFSLLQIPLSIESRRVGSDDKLEAFTSQGQIPIPDRETYTRIKSWQIPNHLKRASD